MNRYICTKCGQFCFSSAGPDSTHMRRCPYAGCDGKIIPASENQGEIYMRTRFTEDEKQAFYELCQQACLQVQFGLMGNLGNDKIAVTFMIAYAKDLYCGGKRRKNILAININRNEYNVEKIGKETETFKTFAEALHCARKYLKEVAL
jgi:hypothetical protein